MGNFQVAEVPFELAALQSKQVKGFPSWELMLVAYVLFEGARDYVVVRALIDTGSRVPLLFRFGLTRPRTLCG